MSKNKLTPEKKFQQDFDIFYERATKNNENTFWYPEMKEILPLYINRIKSNPEDIENTLITFAWHAFVKALRQR